MDERLSNVRKIDERGGAGTAPSIILPKFPSSLTCRYERDRGIQGAADALREGLT